MDEQKVLIGEESRVTVRFVVFIVVQALLIAGGWYTIRADVCNLQERFLEMKQDIKEIQRRSENDWTQRSSTDRQLAVMATQMSQLEKAVLVVAEKVDAHMDDARRRSQQTR